MKHVMSHLNNMVYHFVCVERCLHCGLSTFPSRVRIYTGIEDQMDENY